MKENIKSGIFGFAIADALGVPVEFQSRKRLKSNPVTDMRGFGTYYQPPGTWSDDTSMTLCLLDSLSEGKLDYIDIMEKFSRWMTDGAYTPYDELFDIGNGTRQALLRFRQGVEPLECGGKDQFDNGNGSLMRILPMAYYVFAKYGKNDRIEEKLAIVHAISSLTHAHIRSQIACGIYVCIAMYLLDSCSIESAVEKGISQAFEYYSGEKMYSVEVKKYTRLKEADFKNFPEETIKSSGYVVDTLEAAIWCLLNTNTYEECVLKAVNLGEDTDTVAAVTGGLAGIVYGTRSIPKEWMEQLAKKEFIEDLCVKFKQAMDDIS